MIALPLRYLSARPSAPNPKQRRALRARYPDVRSPKQTKPPAYLFRYYQCQRATQRQKPDQCALIFRRARLMLPLNYPPRLQLPAPSDVPSWRRSAAGEGAFTDTHRGAQVEKLPKLHFFSFFHFPHENMGLAQFYVVFARKRMVSFQ